MANMTTYLDERYLLRQGHVKIGLGDTGAVTVQPKVEQRRVSTATGNTGSVTVSAAGVVQSTMIAVSCADVAVGDIVTVGIGTGGDANRKLMALGTYGGTNSVNVRLINTTASAIAVSAPLYIIATPVTTPVPLSATNVTVSCGGAAVGDIVVASLGAGGDANHKLQAVGRVVAANSVKVDIVNTTGSAIAISAPVYVIAVPIATFVNQSGTAVTAL